jgi:hypothetical protein
MLRSYAKFLEELSPYAVVFRYPGDFIPPSEREAEELLSQLLAFRADLPSEAKCSAPATTSAPHIRSSSRL